MAKPIKKILPEHNRQESKEAEEEEEEEESPIHGDVLEAMVLTRLTLLDLVAASHVSKAWRSSVSTSLRISPRLKPWFIVYALHHRNRSLTSAFAFDPFSRVWLRIQNTHFTTTSSVTVTVTASLRSSDSQHLLYSLSNTGFSFSFDPFHLTWHHVKPPIVWRENPIVVRLGYTVLVAGGTCYFDDDPLAVEMCDISSGRWETCPSMPSLFEDSATSTWISTAVSDNRKLYLLEKRFHVICSFDAETKKWGEPFNLNLISNSNNINVSHSTIGFVDDRLVVVGLIGEPDELQGLGLWEVDQSTYECRQIGEMPPEMLKMMRETNSPLRVSIEGGSIYIYDPRNPEQIFFCEFKEGICKWGYTVKASQDLHEHRCLQGRKRTHDSRDLQTLQAKSLIGSSDLRFLGFPVTL